ncbi:MAG: OadG family transporter subunit [Acutalibacteraceae bacterium]
MTFLPLFSITDAVGIAGFGFGVVLVLLLVIACFVSLLSKTINGVSKKTVKKGSGPIKSESNPSPVIAQEKTVVTESIATDESTLPYTPGYVTLDGVSEQDAAVIMAITSHESGIPLESLVFKYIKRINQEPELINVEEQDAAVVMAIISDKTGIPLDNLIFNSIKLVEE